MLRATFGVLLLLILFVHSAADARPADVDWRVTRTGHFIIYYANSSASVAARISSSAEKWYDILSHKLGFSPGGVTPVYLYPDRIAFSNATGYDRADTIVGLAQAHVIRVDASGAFADVEQVLAHEMVHVFIARRLHGNAGRLPLWVHEGLAQYLADDWGHSDQDLLQEAVSVGAILPLNKIAVRFPEDKRGRAVAYAQSYSIVKYIADKYTMAALRDLIMETRQGRPFEIACLYSLGTEPEDLERDWRQFLWDKYGRQRWHALGTAVVSAAMVIFAILAFLSRLRQKRHKALEFEEETES